MIKLPSWCTKSHWTTNTVKWQTRDIHIQRYYCNLFLEHQRPKDPARANEAALSKSLIRSLWGRERLAAKFSKPGRSGTPREPTWRVISSNLYPLALACSTRWRYFAVFLRAASSKLVSKHSVNSTRVIDLCASAVGQCGWCDGETRRCCWCRPSLKLSEGYYDCFSDSTEDWNVPYVTSLWSCWEHTVVTGSRGREDMMDPSSSSRGRGSHHVRVHPPLRCRRTSVGPQVVPAQPATRLGHSWGLYT